MSGETIKIAMFGHKSIPSRAGGVEVVVEELATRMAAMGYPVACYNRSGSDRKSCKGVALRTVPTIHKKGLAAVTSSFFAALASAFSDADVVHIHAEGPALMCWLPKLFGKAVVVTVHGLDWQRAKWKGSFGASYIRWGEKAAVRFADEIIVLSADLQQYFEKIYRRRTVLIPNGAEKPEIPEANVIKTQFGLSKDSYILFLGRLVPEKGIHILIEAFKGCTTNKRLVIAGEASDTPAYADSLRLLAAADERILFTGFAGGQLLAELYSNAYFYVLPSQLEGMPLSLLEAMSYGNCCVVSDIPACTEVVEDRAVIFPAGDTAALQACLQRLCDAPEQVMQYRNLTEGFICSKYSWEKTTEKTLELYRKACAGRKA